MNEINLYKLGLKETYYIKRIKSELYHTDVLVFLSYHILNDIDNLDNISNNSSNKAEIIYQKLQKFIKNRQEINDLEHE